jgi:hypothetical protein
MHTDQRELFGKAPSIRGQEIQLLEISDQSFTMKLTRHAFEIMDYGSNLRPSSCNIQD